MYNSPTYGYREEVFYTDSSMLSKYHDYVMTEDISQDIAGYTFYGVSVFLRSDEVMDGVYKTRIVKISIMKIVPKILVNGTPLLYQCL